MECIRRDHTNHCYFAADLAQGSTSMHIKSLVVLACPIVHPSCECFLRARTMTYAGCLNSSTTVRVRSSHLQKNYCFVESATNDISFESQKNSCFFESGTNDSSFESATNYSPFESATNELVQQLSCWTWTRSKTYIYTRTCNNSESTGSNRDDCRE